MNCKYVLLGAALAALSFAKSQAAVVDPGTYVTDPSQVAGLKPVAAGTGSAAGDAISLSIANDSTNLYLYFTFNGTATFPNGLNVEVDSDNNTATGYNVFGQSLVGANFGLQNDFPFTQTATYFDSRDDVGNNPPTFGTVVVPSDSFTESGSSELITISLATTQQDSLDAGGYSGLVFPSTFTLESFQDDGDVVGPVTYTLAAVPEPASLSLLAVGAFPLLRRRRSQTA